jgi:hypothetical protein
MEIKIWTNLKKQSQFADTGHETSVSGSKNNDFLPNGLTPVTIIAKFICLNMPICSKRAVL